MVRRTRACTSPKRAWSACSTMRSTRRRTRSPRRDAWSSATRSSSAISRSSVGGATMADVTLQALRSEMRDELVQRILPFWMEQAADRRFGGVLGLITEGGLREEEAPKGCILHARVLWTFAAAYRA